jgi:peptidoglycan/LPS O-acetylase OafA/YrhL
MARRIARIVPLYWAATAAFLVVAAVLPQRLNSEPPGAMAILASLFFVPWTRSDGLVQPVYSLGWTLNYEMLFYVVFACFVGLRRGAAIAGVTLVLGGAVIAGAVFQPQATALQFWTHPIVLEFLMGMGIALLAERGLALPGWLRLALVPAAFALIALGPALLPDGLLAFKLATATMLVAAAALGREPPLPRWLSRLMGQLGDASYAIYLAHPFVLRGLTVGWTMLALSGGAAAVAASALAVALVVAVSLASHRWFEAPLTRRLSAALGGRR